MPVRAFRGGLLLVLTLAGGCDSGEGTPVDRLSTFEIVEEFRVGGVMEGLVFDQVWDMSLGTGDHLAVLESDQVTVLSGRGELKARFGRRGAGPGEFLQVSGLGWLGDTIWVGDGGTHRFSLFTPDGELLDVISPVVLAPQHARDLPPRPYFLFPGREILARTNPPFHLLTAGTVDSIPYFLMDTGGAVTRQLFRGPTPQPLWIHNPDSDNPFSGRITDQPFVVDPLVRPSGVDRSIVTVDLDEDTATVHKVSVGGDTLWSTSVPALQRPVTDADIDSVVYEKSESFVTSPAAEGASVLSIRSWVRDALIVPGYWAPIRDVEVGADGTVWVERFGSEQGTEWIVLHKDGGIVGRVALPDGFRVQAVSGNRVAGVVRDDLDVPHVVSYRLHN